MDQIAGERCFQAHCVQPFRDKETLFAAAAKAYCEQQLPTSLFEVRPDVPLRERLMQIAQAFFAMVSSPEAVSGHRILCTPADGRIGAPADVLGSRSQARAGGPLRPVARASGQRRTGDRRCSARILAVLHLLNGEPHAQLVFGCGGACEGDTAAHLAATVDLFLRAYAPR